MPLTIWGYRLEKPGAYTREGIPQIQGVYAVADTTTVRSNEVAFTIREDPTAAPQNEACGQQTKKADRPTTLGQQPVRRADIGTGKDIHAHIETRQSSYAVGDTACLRVTLVNTSDRKVAFVGMGAADMIHLVITRNGTRVQPNVGPQGTASAAPAGFQPHATLPLEEGRWLPITVWGYRLEEAGDYSIEGIPQIAGGFAIADPTTVRSNDVVFG